MPGCVIRQSPNFQTWGCFISLPIETVAAAEVARINLLVAVPIRAMIYPMIARIVSSATVFTQAVIAEIRRPLPIFYKTVTDLRPDPVR